MKPLKSYGIAALILMFVGAFVAWGVHNIFDHLNDQKESSTSSTPFAFKWIYTSGASEMTNKRWWQASLISSDGPALDFPYQGGSPIVLAIGKNEGNAVDVSATMLILTNGQFDCSSYGSSNSCPISVRADDGKMFTLQGIRSECGKNQCISLYPYYPPFKDADGTSTSDIPFGSLPELLRHAKKLIVEVTLFKFGAYNYHFQLDGLIWSKQTDRQ